MICPKKIIQSMQVGDAFKTGRRWFVQFAVVFKDGTEGRIFRESENLSELVNQSGRAYPIDGLHYAPPELRFTKECEDCKDLL